MTQDTDSKGGWIDYKPGDPVPSLRVRVRFLCGEELSGFWSADSWDWEETGPYQIVAYLPEAAPALVEALKQFVAHYPMGVNPFLDEAYRTARQALQAAGVNP